MRTINREELKTMLDNPDKVQLVMTYTRLAFEQVHIPGSLLLENLRDASKKLSPETETVVYCTNPACYASIRAYHQLRGQGFTKIARYAGGLEDWSAGGYRLEGRGVA